MQSNPRIHPTAIIDPKAELGEGVEVGSNAIIEANVKIGDRTRVGPLVHIQGTTEIGPDNVIHTGATIGFPPQYLGFDGSATLLAIGARNTIREYVSIHRSLNDQSVTSIGNDNFIMGFSHIAHDCHVGNSVIIANGALLAGHVTVGDRAFISGNSVVHQFCRIGRLAMISGLMRVTRDVPPFVIVGGHEATVHGINRVGLRRAGIPMAVQLEIKDLLRRIYLSENTITAALAKLEIAEMSPEGREFVDFYKNSRRGMTPFSRHPPPLDGGGDESGE